MIFDVYYPFRTREGKAVPGTRPNRLEWMQVMDVMGSQHVKELIVDIRSGKKERKIELPAICWTGVTFKTRMNKWTKPTGLVMVDIDHCQDAGAAHLNLWKRFQETDFIKEIGVIHMSPSGGLRIVFRGQEGLKTLSENMEWFKNLYHPEEFGDFDTSCKDYSRISFLVTNMDLFYVNNQLLGMKNEDVKTDLVNDSYETPNEEPPSAPVAGKAEENAPAREDNETKKDDLFGSVQAFTDDEIENFKKVEYRGTPLSVIVDKYVQHFGTPTSGEIHNYYNEMVKNFRCIADNNKRLLLYILPRFGHSIDECASQIKSICKVNTLSSLPKQFYFFLKDNGFYKSRETEQGALRQYMMNEEEPAALNVPYLPPIFSDLVGTAPKDFVLPCINALLPVIGTLTSYVQAKYPYDDRMHTTSFFSVIYAPPGTGKGFVERFMDLLFVDLKLRDFVQSERENIYLRVLQRKGSNDKAPDAPHTSLRLIPAKNSEAEFLQKQRDNHGYHMFTYAAEMDSWAKGVRAAGGNKDDMIRIAWDNGEYGQQFKSFNTFKGTVNLYWNVLITGTLQQVESYFKNVENGLVTRCSFTSIDNQEFAAAPKWRKISSKSMKRINDFVRRCDENSYESPCTIIPEDIQCISDDDFDKEVDWKFKFRERQTVDCSWIMPTIEQFHKEQMQKAALDIDKARDVFRRRVGVRGFRLALMCTCLWRAPKKTDLERCCVFIKWWMEQDLESMLKLWGQKYNEQADTTPKLVQRSVFNDLPQTFSRNDVYVVCMKQGIKTPIRRILFDWKKLNYVEQIDKETFKKKA